MDIRGQNYKQKKEEGVDHEGEDIFYILFDWLKITIWIKNTD